MRSRWFSSLWTLTSVALLAPALAAEPPPTSTPPPDAPGAFARDRNFDMVRLELDGTLDVSARTVAATATWTVRRLAPGGLRLDAVGLRVERVTVDGEPAEVLQTDEELTVVVPEQAAQYEPGAVTKVTITYTASPQLGLHWRAPSADSPDTYPEVYSQGEGPDNRYWFPCYDHPDDRFAYAGRFIVAGSPKGWTVVTNDGPDLVSYLVMVAAAPYDTVVGPPNAVPLRARVPPGTPDSWVGPVLDPLPDMLAHFATRTGVPYPWDRYDQTFVQRFIYGGMENTGSTIETAKMLAPPSVQKTRPWVPSIVAHELAHQWYGDLLTSRTWRELWLNEGFATFLTADWEAHAMGAAEGPAAAAALRAAQIDGWRRSSLDRGSLAGRWFLGGEANHNVYAKGAMVLQMLRALLGEETFWGTMQAYTRKHAHSSVDTVDLQRAMETRSGRDLGWFFQQWTELPGVPKLTTSWTWTPDPGDTRRGVVAVELRQQAGSGEKGSAPYALPVKITVDGASPTTAWLRGESLTVTVPCDQAPAFVAIDPDGGLLVDWEQNQSQAAWAAQLARGTPYAQLLAVRELADLPAATPDALADAFLPAAVGVAPPLRAGIADALSTRRTCDPLVPAALTDVDERIRLAASTALGKCPDRELAPLLLARFDREPNADVRAARLLAAAAIDPQAALSTARATLRRRDALEAEVNAAAAALGAGNPADVPALLHTPASRDLRSAGLRASVSILNRLPLGPDRERLRVTIARSADRTLDDLDLRGLHTGIGVLRDVGDAHSAALLEALARRSTVPDTARRAREAAVAIAGRVDAVSPATPNEAAARYQELADRVKALEDKASERH
ncbi:MAG: hypothetical protein EXR71_20410 [Myxococcales bacterium]|nr:hypothetical protein [Myxococcales bacterium]